MIIELTDRFSLGPVLEHLDQLGLQAQVIEWRGEPLVVALGAEPFGGVLRRVRGVAAVHAVPEPFQLVSRRWQRQDTVVLCGQARTGGQRPVVIADPGLAGGDEAEAVAAALALANAGVDMLRYSLDPAPASPYAAEGPRAASLQLVAAARRASGLPVIVDVADAERVADTAKLADGLEVGPHCMRNLPLLRAVARTGRPVLLRRAPGATVEDWLLAAERIFVEGNPQVMLCDQGVPGPDPRAERLLDLTVVPRLQALTHLPVLIDAGSGASEPAHPPTLVPALARAAVAAGAQGVLLAVGPGTGLDLAGVAALVHDLRSVAEVCRLGERPAAGLSRP